MAGRNAVPSISWPGPARAFMAAHAAWRRPRISSGTTVPETGDGTPRTRTGPDPHGSTRHRTMRSFPPSAARSASENGHRRQRELRLHHLQRAQRHSHRRHQQPGLREPDRPGQVGQRGRLRRKSFAHPLGAHGFGGGRHRGGPREPRDLQRHGDGQPDHHRRRQRRLGAPRGFRRHRHRHQRRGWLGQHSRPPSPST